jgi:hypothetical protein
MSAEIRAVQRALVNHLGVPLTIDGHAGPETQWAMAMALQPVERQMAVRRAQRHLGVLETGANVDPDGIIRDYLAECGINYPAAYCAAAASCWIAVPRVRIASAVLLGRRFPATESPQPGDLAWFPTGGGFGHIELVAGVDDDEVMTFGANVQNGFRCVRRLKAGLNFARTPFPVGDSPPPGVIRSAKVLVVKSGTLEGTR